MLPSATIEFFLEKAMACNFMVKVLLRNSLFVCISISAYAEIPYDVVIQWGCEGTETIKLTHEKDEGQTGLKCDEHEQDHR